MAESELVDQVNDLVNTAGNGFDILLAGGDRDYELLNNVFLHARLEARYADRPDQVKREVKRRFPDRAQALLKPCSAVVV